ncbi:hypothetical protein [Paenibacillus sp. P22]|uniref:hypothetical protein n=1 Tax=Paenibacillus TaxID=44249 RepID=UPI0018DD724B|nr:hypothetical protein [Paenibacillus sp. P22]
MRASPRLKGWLRLEIQPKAVVDSFLEAVCARFQPIRECLDIVNSAAYVLAVGGHFGVLLDIIKPAAHGSRPFRSSIGHHQTCRPWLATISEFFCTSSNLLTMVPNHFGVLLHIIKPAAHGSRPFRSSFGHHQTCCPWLATISEFYRTSNPLFGHFNPILDFIGHQIRYFLKNLTSEAIFA